MYEKHNKYENQPLETLYKLQKTFNNQIINKHTTEIQKNGSYEDLIEVNDMIQTIKRG